MTVKLRVGQWVEAENGDLDGPLFQHPNGQFTVGLQFITWDEDGKTTPIATEKGYNIVKTYDSDPGQLYDLYFYMKKFPYISRATALQARNTIVKAKEYVAESKAIINSIEDGKLRKKLMKEFLDF